MTELTVTGRSAVADEHELAVSVRDLHVEYRVFEDRLPSMQRAVQRGQRSRDATLVHALDGVTFDVAVGEAVGIVGPNGSGKSTLLRAVAGLESKSAGLVLVRGDARLLSVGATLKPRLSGYRNVMLGGLAMGLRRSEIQSRLGEVAEFSGLGPALGRPMQTYSSGMRARLAFSIATLTTPEVLLIDEALAVGDREFREKSLARINEIRDGAGTVIMVTHNLDEIRRTCSRAIWLEEGHIVADGTVADVLERYTAR